MAELLDHDPQACATVLHESYVPQLVELVPEAMCNA